MNSSNLKVFKNVTHSADHLTYSNYNNRKEFTFSMYTDTVENLQYFFENNVNFDSLVFNNLTSTFLTTDTKLFESIARHSPNVSILTFITCKIYCDTAATLVRSCKMLQKLIIVGDFNFLTNNNTGVTASVIDLFHSENIINDILFDNFTQITFENVIVIIQKCPHLHTFHLIECKKIAFDQQEILKQLYGTETEQPIKFEFRRDRSKMSNSEYWKDFVALY